MSLMGHSWIAVDWLGIVNGGGVDWLGIVNGGISGKIDVLSCYDWKFVEETIWEDFKVTIANEKLFSLKTTCLDI